MTHDCKTCPVSTGTHKPAEALHQIAEPAASVEKQIKDAIDALVMAAFTEGGCSEHRMSEARIQTELRKKELCTLLSTPQPCSRSHPHEEMTAQCELRTEIARLTNALARAEAAAPQAVPGVGALYALQEAEAALELAIHRILKRDPGHAVHVTSEAEALVAVRAALDTAAPAHPAEGVPAPFSASGIAPCPLCGSESKHVKLGEDIGHCILCWNDDCECSSGHFSSKEDAIASWNSRAALAATQPAAQRMERDAERYRLRLETIRALCPSAPSDIELDTAIDAALAAQAKQGGVEHG